MQTFVLAPQSPKKYYVHNDIFRYQDEVRISKFFFFKSSGIACRGLLTYLYSPLFIHFYTYIPFKLCSKVFNEGEESVGTSSLPLDSAEIEPAQIKVFHLYMRLCV